MTVGFVRDDALRPVAKYTLGKVASAEQGAHRIHAQGLPHDWAVVTIDLFKDAGLQDLKAVVIRSLDENPVWIDRVMVAKSIQAFDE